MDKFDPDTASVDYLVGGMPCDPDLIEPLGQISWAAIRFNAGLRDHLLNYTGTTVNPYKWTLGEAVRRLRDFSVGADDTEMVAWIDEIARPAIRARNTVVHATPYTAADGKQAIGANDAGQLGRLMAGQLRAIAARLVHASSTMPSRDMVWARRPQDEDAAE